VLAVAEQQAPDDQKDEGADECNDDLTEDEDLSHCLI